MLESKHVSLSEFLMELANQLVFAIKNSNLDSKESGVLADNFLILISVILIS